MRPGRIFKNTSFLIVKILLFCSVILLPYLAAAQIDKEFWFVAPSVFDAGRDFGKPINLRITSAAAPATVVISMPANPSFTPITRTIASNSTVSVDLTPWIAQIENTPANTILNRGLKITSTADITAYYEVVSSFCDCDPEIFSLKGKNAIGTEFFISSQYTYDESTAYAGTNSFDIVATQNNTSVTITPSKSIIGHPANAPFTIVLNAGQTYSAVASSSAASGHLQGSYIKSDNPVAVTLKDDLVQVSSCADLAGDQTVPTNVLGSEYIVTKGFLQPYDNVYIMAIADGTSVYLDGNATPAKVLAKGESFTINLSNPSTYIRSDKNIYVYQFTGNGCEVGSAIIPKINCTGSQSVSVVRSNSDLFAVMITTKTGNQGSFTVNGNPSLVKSSDFAPVPGTGGAYLTARVDLSSSAVLGSPLNFSNSTGNFSLGFINGGTNSGTRYGFFSDFKSSNVQNSSVEVCPAGSVQLTAYGGVTYKWAPTAGLSDPNIANPLASPAATTDYTVTITTADGCIDFANVHVKVVSSVTPTISIAASGNNVCPGTAVTFTATQTNGGSAPVYQWQVNGANVGANSPTFTSTTLANGDKVTCTFTSNATCAAPAILTSNSITMVVNSAIPSVSIVASTNNTCPGTPISFTATPVNGGATPTYQWQVNGTSSGANIPTYSSNSLVNGDKVTCIITSNAACVAPGSVTSNSITMIINPDLPASISITASQNNICAGTAVNFTATPVNGGTAPVYQWMVNGFNTGANSPTFSSSTLNNNDKITCAMTSNGLCATPGTATSNIVTIIVSPYLTPSVTITASSNSICAGKQISFTATAVNAGILPAYQWRINGIIAGSNSPTFTSNTLANGDVVNCIVTSTATCSTVPTATSNNINITIDQPVTPSVTITSSANNVCAGTPITFTATSTNGGSTPAYQWLVNGNSQGTNSNIFISTALANTDVVTCQLTSAANCATPLVVSSNNINMIINPLPVVNAGSNKTIEQGSSIKLNATGSGFADITWSPATGLDNFKTLIPIANPSTTTVYTITAMSTNGCVATSTVKVTVLEDITIPNTFTPNSDGVNDKWAIKNLIDYPDCSVKVFDRSGREVFISRGYGSPWDGTKNGRRLPFATYYYVINLNNNTPPLSGYVVIIK